MTTASILSVRQYMEAVEDRIETLLTRLRVQQEHLHRLKHEQRERDMSGLFTRTNINERNEAKEEISMLKQKITDFGTQLTEGYVDWQRLRNEYGPRLKTGVSLTITIGFLLVLFSFPFYSFILLLQ